MRKSYVRRFIVFLYAILIFIAMINMESFSDILGLSWGLAAMVAVLADLQETETGKLP